MSSLMNADKMSKQVRSRPPLSPTKLKSNSPSNTISILQTRLETAEGETRRINETLENLGFPTKDVYNLLTNTEQMPVSPFKSRGPVTEQNTVEKNYELLVSRTCRLESTLQSLKLNLCSIQAEKDLARKTVSSNEKLVVALEAYDREVNKNKKALDQLRLDKKNAEESLSQAEVTLADIRKELQAVEAAKAESIAKEEDANCSKQKLTRRVGELKDELQRERTMRISLEESQASLLKRVKDMETQVETERQHVNTVSLDSTALKKDIRQLQHSLEAESNQRSQGEKVIARLQKENQSMGNTIKVLEEEKTLLMSETGRVRALYKELNENLETMRKTFEEKTGIYKKLEIENQVLQKSRKRASEDHAQLVTSYEERLIEQEESFQRKLQSQDQMIELREKLRKESKERDRLDVDCDRLKVDLASVSTELKTVTKEKMDLARENAEKFAELREQITYLESEREKSLIAKDSLLTDVNTALDEMREERTKLDDDLNNAKKEIDRMKSIQIELECEKSRLCSRLHTFESQQSTHQQLDAALNEMVEQKNKLAYDKGRLQAKVDHLQEELASMTLSHSETIIARKQKQDLETKYAKSQGDLKSIKLVLIQQEAELKQIKEDKERNQREIALAVEARDEAIRRIDLLTEQLAKGKDTERNKVSFLNQNLAESREENQKMATTLESVIQSHTTLQMSLENLQIQLGKKDAQLVILRQESDQGQSIFKQMKQQLEEASNKLGEMEESQSNAVEPLRHVLEQTRSENIHLANQLSTAKERSAELVAQISKLQDDLEQQAYLNEQQKVARDNEREESRRQNMNYEDRIKNLKEQAKTERAKTMNKINKENNHLKRLHENLTSKISELNRVNGELKKELSTSHESNKDIKAKLGSQRAQLEQLHKTKRTNEETIHKLTKLNEQVKELENMRNQNVKKNETQAETIKKFTSQILELRAELKSVSDEKSVTNAIIKKQETEIERLKASNYELERNWKFEMQNKVDLAKLSKQMEYKLRDINNESLQMAGQVHETDKWFKQRAENLQKELEISKKVQHLYAEDAVEQSRIVEEEKRKARAIAEQAEAILQHSRRSLSHLADVAEINRVETKYDLQDVYQLLALEREASRNKDEKIRRLKNSSLRQMEDLVRIGTPDTSFLVPSPRTSSPYFMEDLHK